MDGSTNAPWRTKSRLRQKYWDEGKSMSDIADEFDTTMWQVRKAMDEFDIQRRGDGGTNPNARYKDEGWLQEQYHEREQSTQEIADSCGVDPETIRNWMKEFDIDRRDNAPNPDAPYRDKERMQRLYVEEGLSTQEIADRLGYGKQAIRRWLHRHGIDVRPSNKDKPPHFRTAKDGYEKVITYSGGEYHRIRLHRLLAVAEGKLPPKRLHGDREIDVHHKNGIPWDNRPDNIETMSRSDHARLHSNRSSKNSPKS